MSKTLFLFVKLCSAIQTFDMMRVRDKRRAAIRDTGANLLESAVRMVPEVLRDDPRIEDALTSAMASARLPIIEAFPRAAYGTYTLKPGQAWPTHWSRETDPAVILAVAERGLRLDELNYELLKRAFRQREASLQEWALTYLAQMPGKFEWLTAFDDLNMPHDPEFAQALFLAASEASPDAALAAFCKAVKEDNGMLTCLFLNAGLQLPSDAPGASHDKLKRLSNHKKIRVLRGGIAAFAADRKARRAAFNIFED